MQADPSFISFVNSTANDIDDEFEVTFHNQSLKQILGSKIEHGLKELNELVEEPVFFNPELARPISLQEAARGRYSDVILSQVYKLELKNQAEE